VVKYALENDGYPIDLQLKSNNPRGIAFYASLAAFRAQERLSFDLFSQHARHSPLLGHSLACFSPKFLTEQLLCIQ
jgi:hypothetical protein